MKTTILILAIFLFGIIGYSQVKTKVIIVDLSEPNKNSIKIYEGLLCENEDNCKCKSKWLSVKSKEMVAIKLINGNPFKYTYKIDTKNISFFNDENTSEKIIEEAKKEVKKDMKLLSDYDSIKDIVNRNKQVVEGIDSLSIEVKSLYETLNQKNTLVEADYTKRKEFLTTAKEHLKTIYKLLLNNEEKFEEDALYSNIQKSLLETKDKAEKSIENIIYKFYSINFDIYTLPIDIQGKNINALEFKIHRFDKETKVEDTDFASTPYNIWIKGGLKIDVSAGLFFSSLYDYEFDKRDDLSTPGNKIITLKNKGAYDLAFGSMINTYVRMNSWVVPTINFGAALTKNEKLQVLFGGGVILGKEERIIFTAGISMGKVERIADSYSVGESYNLGDSGTLPTQSEFKFGHFFGVTYNLSKVKKISLEKGIE